MSHSLSRRLSVGVGMDKSKDYGIGIVERRVDGGGLVNAGIGEAKDMKMEDVGMRMEEHARRCERGRTRGREQE